MKPPKFEHICSCHITFPPFLLCRFDTNLCVPPFLRRYIQKGKGHSKNCTPQTVARNSLLPGPQIAKFGFWLAKTLSCDRRLPLRSYKAIHFQPRKNPQNICNVTSSNHHNSAMLQVKNIDPTMLQLSILATGLGNYPCHSLGGAIFLVTLAFLDDLLRKGAYRDISHIILKHTQ